MNKRRQMRWSPRGAHRVFRSGRRCWTDALATKHSNSRRSAQVFDTLVLHLPAYSPELNPDEGLNANLKQAVTRKPPARSKDDLKRNVISHMRRLSKRPDRIRSYFGHHTFRYAA